MSAKVRSYGGTRHHRFVNISKKRRMVAPALPNMSGPSFSERFRPARRPNVLNKFFTNVGDFHGKENKKYAADTATRDMELKYSISRVVIYLRPSASFFNMLAIVATASQISCPDADTARGSVRDPDFFRSVIACGRNASQAVCSLRHLQKDNRRQVHRQHHFCGSSFSTRPDFSSRPRRSAQGIHPMPAPRFSSRRLHRHPKYRITIQRRKNRTIIRRLRVYAPNPRQRSRLPSAGREALDLNRRPGRLTF